MVADLGLKENKIKDLMKVNLDLNAQLIEQEQKLIAIADLESQVSELTRANSELSRQKQVM